MAENAVFKAGLEIVPQFNRNDVSKQLKSLMEQMSKESESLSKAIKIGVRIDTAPFLKATAEYSKAIDNIGRALEEENKKGFKGKNTKLFSLMEQAKKTREEIQNEIENTMMEKHGRVYKVKKIHYLYDEITTRLQGYNVIYLKGEIKISVDKDKKYIRKEKLNDLKKIL